MSNEEGTHMHAEFEKLMSRLSDDLDRLPNERRFMIIDETWQPRPYQLELIEQLKRQVVKNDPRPTKGKFEPPHLFNSRLRNWLRRNP